MTALEYILDGLEAELALERELGIRVVECDRSLLEEGKGKREEGKGKREEGKGNGERGTGNGERGRETIDARRGAISQRLSSNVSCLANPPTQTPPNPNTQTPPNPNTQTPPNPNTQTPPNPNTPKPTLPHSPTSPFVFLHHRPLSDAGEEMVAKITAALGATPESAPVAVDPPLPAARVYVVLGGLALKKWFPGRNAAPGQWVRSDGGVDVLVTYSPEYILRFNVVTPAVMKMKHDMWNSLKEMKRRLLK